MLLVMSACSAYADHHGGGGGGAVIVRDHRSPAPAPVVVRDHRSEPVVVRDHRSEPVVVRDHRGGPPPARVVRGPVRVYNGRYAFPGGTVRVVHRPVIRRYYDARIRPPIVVETYEPVPGYMWMEGNWRWGGDEWVWMPGYFAAAPEPAMGVSVSAGVVID